MPRRCFAFVPERRGPTTYRLLCIRQALGALPQARRAANEAVLRGSPSTPFFRELRLSILIELGDFHGALADAIAVLETKPNDAEIWNYKGRCHFEEHDLSEAIAAFDQSIELRPANPVAYVNRAFVFLRLAQAEESLTDAQKAVELDPLLAEAWRCLAECQYTLEQFHSARHSIDRAIELRADKAEFYTDRALILMEFREHGAAFRDFQQAVRLGPSLTQRLLREYREDAAVLESLHAGGTPFSRNLKRAAALLAQALG